MGIIVSGALALLMYNRLSSLTVDFALSDLGKRVYTLLNAKRLFDGIVNNYVIRK